MVKMLREAEAAPVAEVAKKHGISDATIYGWRKRYGQLDQADVKRLGHLEQKNAKLKKLVADRDLELEVVARAKQFRNVKPCSRCVGHQQDGVVVDVRHKIREALHQHFVEPALPRRCTRGK